jgi:GNAT superfamily N-acetyltransferase
MLAARGGRLSAAISRARLDDAESIAKIHVAGWRESYAALFPKDALDAMDVGAQTALWRQILSAPGNDGTDVTFLFCDAQGVPSGFGGCGRQRSDRLAQLGFQGEFHALYLLRRAQRRGVGRALMAAMAAHLSTMGLARASVWVFRDNAPARRFYETLGGQATGIEGEWTRFGVSQPDIAYGWRDLTLLCRAGKTGAKD